MVVVQSQFLHRNGQDFSYQTNYSANYHTNDFRRLIRDRIFRVHVANLVANRCACSRARVSVKQDAICNSILRSSVIPMKVFGRGVYVITSFLGYYYRRFLRITFASAGVILDR